MIYDNLRNGVYNTDTHMFKEVTWQQAEQYALSGGLAVVSVKKPDHGHVAVLTGGYTGNQSVFNLNIFQAGRKFGHMRYEEGFGDAISKFYIWRKK